MYMLLKISVHSAIRCNYNEQLKHCSVFRALLVSLLPESHVHAAASVKSGVCICAYACAGAKASVWVYPHLFLLCVSICTCCLFVQNFPFAILCNRPVEVRVLNHTPFLRSPSVYVHPRSTCRVCESLSDKNVLLCGGIPCCLFVHFL